VAAKEEEWAEREKNMQELLGEREKQFKDQQGQGGGDSGPYHSQSHRRKSRVVTTLYHSSRADSLTEKDAVE